MRCPKCLIKTSDLEGHVRRVHPQCDDSSSSSHGETAEKNKTNQSTGRKKKRKNKSKGKQPAKRIQHFRRGQPDCNLSSSYDDTDDDPDYVPDMDNKRKRKSNNLDIASNNQKKRKLENKSKGQNADIKRLNKNIQEIKGALARANIPVEKKQIAKKPEATTSNTAIVRYSRNTSSNKRKKRPCPYCNVLVIHVPRHLRDKHKQSADMARLTVARNRDLIKGLGSPTRKYRQCPIELCQAKVKYLSNHLKHVHGFTSDRAAKWSRQLKYKRQVKGQSTEEEDDKEEEEDQEVQKDQVEKNENENNPTTSNYNVDPPSTEEEKDQGERIVQVYDLDSGKELKGWLIPNVSTADEAAAPDSSCKSKPLQRMQQDRAINMPVTEKSESTDDEIIIDLDLARQAITIESKFIKNIEKIDKNKQKIEDITEIEKEDSEVSFKEGFETKITKQKETEKQATDTLVEISSNEKDLARQDITIESKFIKNIEQIDKNKQKTEDITEIEKEDSELSFKEGVETKITKQNETEKQSTDSSVEISSNEKDLAKQAITIESKYIKKIEKIDKNKQKTEDITEIEKEDSEVSFKEGVETKITKQNETEKQAIDTSVEISSNEKDLAKQAITIESKFIKKIEKIDKNKQKTEDITEIEKEDSEVSFKEGVETKITKQNETEKQAIDTSVEISSYEKAQVITLSELMNEKSLEIIPIGIAAPINEQNADQVEKILESSESVKTIVIQNTVHEIIEKSVTISTDTSSKRKFKIADNTSKTKRKKTSIRWPLHRSKGKNWREVPALKDYNAFCRSAERNLGIKNAEQQCQQLFVIWKCVDQQGLFRTGTITNADRIAKLWLEVFVQQKQPGTVKSYLCTLQDFWSYLSMKNQIKANLLTELNARRTMWLKRLRKKSKERRIEVMIRDSEEQISVEDFENFRKSEVKDKVLQILKQKTELTQKDINFVIGFIALTIALHNAQRCGAILGLTLQCYANRTLEADSFVCSVLKHKTGYLVPCELVLSKELCTMINCYLQARRKLPLLQQKDQIRLLAPDAPLFLQWPGTEIDNSQMYKIINRVWSEAGGRQSVSFTKIRKAVVTRFREVRPGSRLALARHMTHMPSTADKFYSLREQRQKAVQISKEICQVMSSQVTCSDEEPQAGTSGESSKNKEMTESENVKRDDKSECIPSKVEMTIKLEKHEASGILKEESDGENISKQSHGRRAFSKDEQEFIENSCRDIIRNVGQPIKQEQVIYAIEETEEGRNFMERVRQQYGKVAGKKVTDRVRTFRRDLFKYKK